MNTEEIIELLKSDPNDLLGSRFANAIEPADEQPELIATIRISNYCSENCERCDDRISNSGLKRYRMATEEIIGSAKQVINHGLKTIELESGLDTYFDADLISHLIYSIKNISNVKVILNIGDRTEQEYLLWKIAGADSVILKSGNSKTEVRLEKLRCLRKHGITTGSVFIPDLSAQFPGNIADEILLIGRSELALLKINLPSVASSVISVDENLKYNFLTLLKILNRNMKIAIPYYLIESGMYQRNRLKLLGINSFLVDYTPSGYLRFNNLRDSVKVKKDIQGLISGQLNAG